MPLAFGLSVGDDFFLDHTRVTLESIGTPTRFKIKVHGESMDQVFEINDQRAIEIMPSVRASAGHKGTGHMVKIAIEAPRNIEINRGKIYRQRYGHK